MYLCTGICIYRARGNSQATPVLAGPVFFSQGDCRIPFLQKAGNASVIFGLVGLIILSFNRWKSISIGTRPSPAHAFCLQGILLCEKPSNKQSGSVIFRLVRLITL